MDRLSESWISSHCTPSRFLYIVVLGTGGYYEGSINLTTYGGAASKYGGGSTDIRTISGGTTGLSDLAVGSDSRLVVAQGGGNRVGMSFSVGTEVIISQGDFACNGDGGLFLTPGYLLKERPSTSSSPHVGGLTLPLGTARLLQSVDYVLAKLDKNSDWESGTYADGTISLGVKCISTVPITVSHIRFLKHPQASQTSIHRGFVWGPTGVQLGSVVFTGETSSGWQTMALPVPVLISANTEFSVTVYFPSDRE